jgi:FKBP-type peptidyl-prolyl cis-trans isomerase SlyD
MTPAQVSPDTFVTLAYELFDERGERVEAVSADDPLEYVHGYGLILPGLERGVEGAEVGSRRTLWVEPADAFGERDEAGVFVVDRAELPTDAKVGDEIEAEGENGSTWVFQVLELLGDEARIDANHPLAGQRVRIEVEVRGVRPATEEEVAGAQSEANLDDDACGCGEPHAAHEHPATPEPLVQLGRGVRQP